MINLFFADPAACIKLNTFKLIDIELSGKNRLLYAFFRNLNVCVVDD